MNNSISTTAQDPTSEGYSAFIDHWVIKPGLRLLTARAKKTPDWPFPDTKFNPNTGADLGPESYEVIHTWVLGRGMEALAVHRDYLSRLALPPEEEARTRELLDAWIHNAADTILELAHRHRGRIPFCVNRRLEAIDHEGRKIVVDPDGAGASDIFAAKGLLASGRGDASGVAFNMLLAAADKIRENKYRADQVVQPEGRIAQGARMLWQGIPSVSIRANLEESRLQTLFDITVEFMEFVLTHHCDPITNRFAEYVDVTTLEPLDYLDPGHCHEFVGLALQAIEVIGNASLENSHGQVFECAKKMLPEIFFAAERLGFNPVHQGIYKAVRNSSGEVLDSNMPWWSLPETIRAATRVCAVSEEDAVRKECLRVIERCHHAYFKFYLNSENDLFPFQTRCGKTGRVLDVVPAIPEGDPLYHSNLSLLDLPLPLRRNS